MLLRQAKTTEAAEEIINENGVVQGLVIQGVKDQNHQIFHIPSTSSL